MRVAAKAAKGVDVQEELKKRDSLLAITDIVTRWDSSCFMCKRGLKIKKHLIDLSNEYPRLFISTTNWNKIETLTNELKRATQLSKIFQSNDLSPGSFFYYWKEVEHELRTSSQVKTI